MSFNGSLRIEARPERLTSEAGAVVLREMLDRVGLTDWLVERLEDPRDPDVVTHRLAECRGQPGGADGGPARHPVA